MAANPKCPKCSENKDVRAVPTDKGLSQRLIHWVCDCCEIGWYVIGASRARLQGGMDAAIKAYVQEGRPEKLKSGRQPNPAHV